MELEQALCLDKDYSANDELLPLQNIDATSGMSVGIDFSTGMIIAGKESANLKTDLQQQTSESEIRLPKSNAEENFPDVIHLVDYNYDKVKPVQENKSEKLDAVKEKTVECIEPTYCCDDCGKDCEDVDKLAFHHRSAHSRSVFACEICGAQFRNTSSLYIHVKHAHGIEKPLKCVCNKIFSKVKDIKVHYEVCKMYQLVCLPQKKDYSQCHVCGEQFHTESQYNRHLRTLHNESRTRDFVCKICNKAFYTNGAMQTHTKNIHYPHSRKCPFCAYAIKNQMGMLQHVYKHELPLQKEKSSYECSFCEYTTNDATDVKEHILVKHNFYKHKTDLKKSSVKSKDENGKYKSRKKERFTPEDLTCDICGRICPNKGSFLDHLALHKGEVTIVCKICDRGFVTRHAYRKHMRQNHEIYCGPRRGKAQSLYVNCQICGVMLCRTALPKHMDIHNGIYRFRCTICDKACRTKHDLTVHARTHTGEKPFKCEICARLFSDQANLRHHQKRIHRITLPRSEFMRKTGFHKPFNKEEQEAVMKWEAANGVLSTSLPVNENDLLTQLARLGTVAAVEVTEDLEFVTTAVDNVYNKQQLTQDNLQERLQIEFQEDKEQQQEQSQAQDIKHLQEQQVDDSEQTMKFEISDIKETTSFGNGDGPHVATGDRTSYDDTTIALTLLTHAANGGGDNIRLKTIDSSQFNIETDIALQNHY